MLGRFLNMLAGSKEVNAAYADALIESGLQETVEYQA